MRKFALLYEEKNDPEKDIHVCSFVSCDEFEFRCPCLCQGHRLGNRGFQWSSWHSVYAGFEKIKSWEGRGIYEERNTIRGSRAAEYLLKYKNAEPNEPPEEIQRMIHNTIEFKSDLKSSRFFCFLDYLEPPAYRDPRNNTTYSLDWGPGEIAFIDTPEYQITISPESWSKDCIIREKCARKQSPRAVDFPDPRKVFYWGNRTVWKTLTMFSQSLQTSGGETYGVVLKEKSAGDHIIYRLEISMPGKNRPFSFHWKPLWGWFIAFEKNNRIYHSPGCIPAQEMGDVAIFSGWRIDAKRNMYDRRTANQYPHCGQHLFWTYLSERGGSDPRRNPE